VVTEVPNMSLSAKREALARIHGRYQRAGRSHKTLILDEFCALCGYHRKAALRLLNRPVPTGAPKRSGPKIIYEPGAVLPVLKAVWLASDQLCSKLLKAALPEWLEHYQRRSAPLPEAFKEKLLQISPAQIDRLLQSVRVQHPRKGLAATRPGTLLRHAVPTRHGPPDTARPGSPTLCFSESLLLCSPDSVIQVWEGNLFLVFRRPCGATPPARIGLGLIRPPLSVLISRLS
jgi:hypothetical protein